MKMEKTDNRITWLEAKDWLELQYATLLAKARGLVDQMIGGIST